MEDRGIKGDCTPLMEAASGGHVDIVRLLLLHHADINAQSSAGENKLILVLSQALVVQIVFPTWACPKMATFFHM